MDELEAEDAPAAGRPATVDDGGIGGHTYLPGTASLVQEIDSKLKLYSSKGNRVCELVVWRSLPFWCTLAERLLVVLRDGRTMIGYLRSVDQFGESNWTSITAPYPQAPCIMIPSYLQPTCWCRTPSSVSMSESSLETFLVASIWSGERMSLSVEKL